MNLKQLYIIDIYVNLMVTTNQKSPVDTQRNRENNPNIRLRKIIKLQGKRLEEQEKNIKKLQKKILENSNKLSVSTCLSMITLCK